MQGQFDRARAALAEGVAARAEHGLTLNRAVSHHAAIAEMLAGDPAAAERILRDGMAALEEMGDRALLSTTAGFLGQALLAQGRAEEADRCAGRSAELAAADDVLTQALWRGVRARAHAARGETDAAERLAREAVAFAQRTDFINHQADALADLALVLGQAGRAEDARAAAAEALSLYERKGNVVAAERTRAQVVALPRV
jgi:tetratricopeptide (TPR) repeat protein